MRVFRNSRLANPQVLPHFQEFFVADGGIGRRAGFKIRFPRGSEGSTPSPGTINQFIL